MLRKKDKLTYFIEFSESSLKLWRHQEGQESTVELLKLDTILSPQDEKTLSLITEYKKAFHLGKEEVGVILPRASYGVRFLDLPNGNRTELHKMIQLQIGQLLPYEPSDVVFDFQASKNANQKGQVRVTLYVVMKDVLANYTRAFRSLSLIPSFISPASPFFAEAYRSLDKGSATNSFFIETNENSSELIAAKGSDIVFSRSLKNHKGFEDEEVFDEIQSAIRKAEIEFSKIGSQKEIQSFITNHPGLLNAIKAKLSDSHPEANITLLGEDLFKSHLKGTETALQSGKSVSLGLGIPKLEKSSLVNLLPGDFLKISTQRVFSGNLKTTVMLGAAFFLCIFLFIGIDFLLKQNLLGKLDKKLTDIRAEAKEAKEILKGTQLIRQTNRNKNLPLVILHEVYQQVPSGVFLTFYEYNLEEGVRVRGMAKNVSQVSDLLLVFQKSGYFEQAEIKFAKKRVERNQEFTDFQINSLLKLT